MDDEQYFADFAEDPSEDFGKILYERLVKLDQLTYTREEKISMNTYVGIFTNHGSTAVPSSKRPYGRGFLLALVSSIATALLIGVFIVNHNNKTPSNNAMLVQPQEIDLDSLEPITLENVSQVE